MIIQKKILKNTLFLDVETVSVTRCYDELPEALRLLWKKKASRFSRAENEEITDEEISNHYRAKAGIFAEFAKVVCITVGYISGKIGEECTLRLKSYTGDESQLLSAFAEMLDHHYDRLDEHFLCGHNIKEFDIPFLCRRMVVNGVRLPRLMNISGKKPWQIAHLVDTMELWRFGDYKNYTSLALIAAVMGIPCPKDDIDGSMVGEVYWDEEDIDRIVTYCEKDVVTVAQVVMKFASAPLLTEDQIESVGHHSQSIETAVTENEPPE